MSSGLKLRAKSFLRRWKEQANFQLVPGGNIGEEIKIDSLIYPLRYDVVVRAEFMSYYLAHQDVYARDLEEFLAHPVAQAYFTSWLSDACRSRPELVEDLEILHREFRRRMRRALSLCDSLQETGYDAQHPIELRAASVIRHEHEKHVQRRFYAGDGCHRLAHLMLQGTTFLTPTQYQVRVYEEFQPRDNTYRLLGRLIRTEAEYCRIMSQYYCDGAQCSNAKDVIEHVERIDPSRLEEVMSVMRVDLGRLAGPGVINEIARPEGHG
jgi:hypothetical protein